MALCTSLPRVSRKIIAGVVCCLKKRSDTVGEPRKAGNFTQYTASLNSEEPGKSSAERRPLSIEIGSPTVSCRLNFLLCCRCCQVLLSLFSPYHSLGAVSHRPDRSGGFLWCWDPSSPTTFYPCRRKHPSPDSLYVFRREPEVLSKATPSIRRLLCKARKFNGPPSPAPGPRRDSVPQHRLGLFEDGSLRDYPTFKEAPQGNK
jgi:hypothetical protein